MKNAALGFLLVLLLSTNGYSLEAGQIHDDETISLGVEAELKNDQKDVNEDRPGAIITNLTKIQVAEIAKEYAIKEGVDLSYYSKVTAIFDQEDGSWDVSFMMDPTRPGGWFDVIVDDKTGAVLDFWLGE